MQNAFFPQLSLPAALPNPALQPNLETFHRVPACGFSFPGASYGTTETTVRLRWPPEMMPAVAE